MYGNWEAFLIFHSLTMLHLCLGWPCWSSQVTSGQWCPSEHARGLLWVPTDSGCMRGTRGAGSFTDWERSKPGGGQWWRVHTSDGSCSRRTRGNGGITARPRYCCEPEYWTMSMQCRGISVFTSRRFTLRCCCPNLENSLKQNQTSVMWSLVYANKTKLVLRNPWDN